MSTIQTICVFISGFVLSRLVLRAGLQLRFVSWIIRRTGGRLDRILFGLMASSFLLSTVIPNALTVLALIPVITRLREAGEGAHEGRTLGTLLTMGLIYGANLGGVGSLIGSPANLYLLLNLELFEVGGRQQLHFASWLTFGLPMASGYLLLCWGMLRLTERRAMGWRIGAGGEGGALSAAAADPQLQRATLRWAGIWAGFWGCAFVATGVLALERMTIWHGALAGRQLQVSVGDLIAVGGTALFAVAMFVVPQGGWPRLLTPRDLVRELPVKGLVLGVGVVLLLVLVAKSGAVEALERLVPRVVPSAGVGPFVTALVLAALTTFTTEVMNNTTVQTVMFPLSLAIARQLGVDPLVLMLGVSLASTCAFMTPVATPVNALAFGGLGRVSLAMFVKNGALANLIGGLWIASWMTWLIPPVLAWYR